MKSDDDLARDEQQTGAQGPSDRGPAPDNVQGPHNNGPAPDNDQPPSDNGPAPDVADGTGEG
jgi:hypothetical protein